MDVHDRLLSYLCEGDLAATGQDVERNRVHLPEQRECEFFPQWLVFVDVQNVQHMTTKRMIIYRPSGRVY